MSNNHSMADPMKRSLTHVDESGEAHMVDVAAKPSTDRRAIATAQIRAAGTTIQAISNNTIKKGDVLAVARIAGIMAAKRTPELIPLCHGISLSSVEVRIELRESVIEVTAEARCVGPTGVEMEALTAAGVAALTIYDMCKSIDRGMTISELKLLEKSGGASGEWSLKEP
jgi:cyclic pyranopterin phosphate synthase